MPPQSDDLDALRRELADGWRLPEGFDGRPAAALGPAFVPEPWPAPFIGPPQDDGRPWHDYLVCGLVDPETGVPFCPRCRLLPLPSSQPTRPGPQPCNQIAGTFEEQMQRARAPLPSPDERLRDTVLDVLLSPDFLDALKTVVRGTIKELHHGQPANAHGEGQRTLRLEPEQEERAARQPADRQPGEEA